MKDIEELLTQHSPKPKRQLNESFTSGVVSKIQSQPKTSPWYRALSTLKDKLFTKVGVASMASIVVVGGTMAAIALWPQPSVTPTISKRLSSGNHIVGYDAQNCNYFDQLNGGPVAPTSDKIYYEIRSNAPFTDQQFKDTLQAMCEDNLSNAAINHIIKQLPNQNASGVQSTESYVINAITPNSLTISPDPHLDTKVNTTKPNLTYTHFSNQLLAYNQNSRVTFSSFKPSDTIKLIVQDTSDQNTETQTNQNPLNSPDNIIILAILKTPPITGNPDNFYLYVGKYIVRVEPCKSSKNGFCRQYDFAN